ncbi:replication initiation protein [Mitsuokella sp.]|uniref:replication initiation protein n=1 Tax=Mitsuokella sp. TaxID=2049034 RepID=UPI003D7D3D14
MGNKLTYQLNPLIEAQKEFDVMETRLFYLGLQNINPHITEKDKYYDKDFPDIVISPAELTKIFGHTQYLTEVDKAADRLIGRYISVRYEDGFGKYTIFQHIRYKEGKGLYIKFNEDMRPFILDIYKSYKVYGFTKIEMKQIFVLSSSYAMRILELLLQYRSKAKNKVIEREITVNDLRKKLNVPDGAYSGRMSSFKRYVIERPIKDINENTKYVVSYKSIKAGHNIGSFRFFCDCSGVRNDDDYKETIDAQPAAEKTPALEAAEKSAEDKKAILKDQMMNAEGFTLIQFNSVIKKWGVDIVAKNFALGREEADAKHLTGRARKQYIKSFVENDYASEREQLQEIKDRESALDAEKKRKQDEMSEAFAAQGITSSGKRAQPKKPRKLTEEDLDNLLSIVAYSLTHGGIIKPIVKTIQAYGFKDEKEFLTKYAERLKKY